MLLPTTFLPNKLPGLKLWLKADAVDAPPLQPDQVAGLQLWLKADAIQGLADGESVTTWSDSSGNGRDFTQSTAAKKPTYQTNEINSQPVVRFDGVDDWMSAGDVLGFERTDSFTIFYVAKQTAGGEASVISKMDRVGGVYKGWAVGNSAGSGNVDFFGIVSDWAANNAAAETYATAAPGAFEVAAYTYDGTSDVAGLRRYRNGSEQAGTLVKNGLAASTITTAQLALGARVNSDASDVGEFDAVDTAEIVVYNATLTAAQRRGVERYLANKYGITYLVADAGSVGYWHDWSGQGNHATQSTAAAQPTLQTAEVNGRAVVRFDAVDDYLTGSGIATDAFTAFAVAKVAAVGNQGVVEFTNGTNRRGVIWTANGPGVTYGAAKYRDVSTAHTGAFKIVTTSSTPAANVDGAGQTLNSESVAAAGFADATYIGELAADPLGSYYLAGDIAEILVYNSALSTANRQRVERYLARRYGITLTP